MTEHRIRYACTLLEDLHCGSGEGHLDVVDDLHAKDRRGRPVCWSTTLLGLLREEAHSIAALGHADLDQIRRIFGREGEGGRRTLQPVSLHFERDAGRDFLLRTQTARETSTRRPLDQTLRTVELASAGATASGELRLDGSPEDAELVRSCLTHLRSLGGSKTRGLGRVGLALEPAREAGPRDELPVRSAGQLRMVVRNLDPILFPRTANPRNILLSETFLPGLAVRGSWLRGLRDAGAPDAAMAVLADPARVRFSPGYPLPGEALDLERLQALPLPFSVAARKETRRPVPGGRSGSPWWMTNSGPVRAFGDEARAERDLLLEAWRTGESSADLKRVKTDSYLCSSREDEWIVVEPELAYRMRNRTPVNRLGRREDSRRTRASDQELAGDTGELFAELNLVEDQLFLVDVDLDAEAAALFAEHAGDFLAPRDVEERRWLRLGRGGRPARVDRYAWTPVNDRARASLPAFEQREIDDGLVHAFTITLASDLIARADDLTFLTRPTAADLAALVGDRALSAGLSVAHAAIETRVVHGFNTAAGTRRLPAIAMRGGSSLVVEGRDAVAVEALRSKLVEHLDRNGGIGERIEEGFGRALVDLAFHRFEPKPAPNVRGTEGEAAGAAEDRERVLHAVLVADLALAKGLKLDHPDAAGPSRTQWQTLRHAIERPGGLSATAALDRLAGRPTGPWQDQVGDQELLAWLRAQLETKPANTDPELFLAQLARCMAARLEDARELQEVQR